MSWNPCNGFRVHLFASFLSERPKPLRSHFECGVVCLHPCAIQVLSDGGLLLIEYRGPRIKVCDENGERHPLMFVLPPGSFPGVQSADDVTRNTFQPGEHPFDV